MPGLSFFPVRCDTNGLGQFAEFYVCLLDDFLESGF